VVLVTFSGKMGAMNTFLMALGITVVPAGHSPPRLRLLWKRGQSLLPALLLSAQKPRNRQGIFLELPTVSQLHSLLRPEGNPLSGLQFSR
jgi:hypothetical protein